MTLGIPCCLLLAERHEKTHCFLLGWASPPQAPALTEVLGSLRQYWWLQQHLIAQRWEMMGAMGASCLPRVGGTGIGAMPVG